MGDGDWSGGDLKLNWIFFLEPVFVSSLVLIGTGFPSALADVDWRFLIDFLVGSAGKAFRGVLFWFKRFGDNAEVVDDFSSSSSTLSELSAGVALVVLFFAFSSVCKLIPRDGCVTRLGRPPVRLPVGLARRFIGLLFPGEPFCETGCCDLFQHWMLRGVGLFNV